MRGWGVWVFAAFVFGAFGVALLATVDQALAMAWPPPCSELIVGSSAAVIAGGAAPANSRCNRLARRRSRDEPASPPSAVPAGKQAEGAANGERTATTRGVA